MLRAKCPVVIAFAFRCNRGEEREIFPADIGSHIAHVHSDYDVCRGLRLAGSGPAFLRGVGGRATGTVPGCNNSTSTGGPGSVSMVGSQRRARTWYFEVRVSLESKTRLRLAGICIWKNAHDVSSPLSIPRFCENVKVLLLSTKKIGVPPEEILITRVCHGPLSLPPSEAAPALRQACI